MCVCACVRVCVFVCVDRSGREWRGDGVVWGCQRCSGGRGGGWCDSTVRSELW